MRISGKGDAGKLRHWFLPGGDVGLAKLLQMGVTAGSRHNLHEIGGRVEKPSEPLRCILHTEALPKMFLLGGNSRRTVVGVTHACGDAPNGLHGGICHGYAICSQCEGLYKIARRANATRDDERNVLHFTPVEMPSRSG